MPRLELRWCCPDHPVWLGDQRGSAVFTSPPESSNGGASIDQPPWRSRERIEAQVGVGLGASFVTIAHLFMIGKETADKACGRFVNAVIKKAGYVGTLPTTQIKEDW
ncbi:hypothetical protein VP01_761g1 [Puccinia sorghi]|uniref:Uncharacterized protein n=1 Tax=Puccinia sorghi TaxID=27349 RepID=A0A0L6UDX9_9BASI|nr:hypothetical protein VP01_761g1 [Puccinia sorghi]